MDMASGGDRRPQTAHGPPPPSNPRADRVAVHQGPLRAGPPGRNSSLTTPANGADSSLLRVDAHRAPLFSYCARITAKIGMRVATPPGRFAQAGFVGERT